MKTRMITFAVIGCLLVSSCANVTETQRGTGVGAGVGAGVGGVIGGVTGGGRGAAIGAGIGALGGAIGGYIWSTKMQEQKRAMEDATKGTGVSVVQTPNNELKLEIPSDISFDSGSAVIKPAMRPVLDRFAQTLNANPVTQLRILGHTDSTGSDAVNNPLSINRAASTRDYLAGRGVAPNRIAIDGHGEREPIADNTTDTGRARNRRVEVFVTEAAQQASAPQPTPR